MPLRPELLAPTVDPGRLEDLCAEIDRITEILESGEEADDDIAAFNALTGHRYGPADFWHYWEHRDVVEFAREAARPRPARLDGIGRDDLVEIVRLVQAGGDDQHYYLALLQANVLHPRAVDLVLHRDLDAEQVVDEALAYQPTS